MLEPWTAKYIFFSYCSPRYLQCSECPAKVRAKSYDKMKASVDRHIRRHKCNKGKDFITVIGGVEVWEWEEYQNTMNQVHSEIKILINLITFLTWIQYPFEEIIKFFPEVMTRFSFYTRSVNLNQLYISNYQKFISKQ